MRKFILYIVVMIILTAIFVSCRSRRESKVPVNKAEYNRVELYTDTINNCEFVIAISYVSGNTYGSSGVSIIHAPFCTSPIHKYNVKRDTLN